MKTKTCLQWLPLPRKLHLRFHPPGSQAPLQHIMTLGDIISCYLFHERLQATAKKPNRATTTIIFALSHYRLSHLCICLPWSCSLEHRPFSLLGTSLLFHFPLKYVQRISTFLSSIYYTNLIV